MPSFHTWAAAAVLGAAAFLHGPARAIEEPAFEVTQVFDGFEVRQYAACVVAETIVPGPADEAGGRAFPVLARYIFGRNQDERRLEMTAPVLQSAAPAGGSVRLQFVMPRGLTRATLPAPLEPAVALHDVPAQRVAVLRYSGGWSQALYDDKLALLKRDLQAQGIAWRGEPVFARYDGPFTLWFLRRNEIWLPLAPG